MKWSNWAFYLVSGCAMLGMGCSQSTGSNDSQATDSPKPAAGAIRVAFVTNNASDFWKIAQAGTEKAEQELGCEVEFRIPSKGTAEEQMTIVEDLIVSGVSGIAISPKDPKNHTDMLNRTAAKVHLVTQDSDAPDSNRVCYIGTNNFEAGLAAGALIKGALPQGGEIMLFVGTLDAQNAQDRKRGIEETLQGSGITILDTRTDETDRIKAIANAQDALVSNPELDCLVGLWSYNGPALLNAVRDSNKVGQVKIVCFDEDEETLRGVQDGVIFGTVVQQPFEFGYRSVKLLYSLAQGDTSVVPEGKQIFVPVLSIRQDSVGPFWKNLNELTGRS